LGLPLTDRLYDGDGVAMAEQPDRVPRHDRGWVSELLPDPRAEHRAGHTSVIHMFQSQANYIAAAVSYAQADGLAGIEPTPAAQAAFTADVDQQSEGTVWTAGGCDSWYLNDSGRNANLWPGTTFDYRRRTLRFDPAAHLTHRPAATAVTVAA
jgi:hypothetical protein